PWRNGQSPTITSKAAYTPFSPALAHAHIITRSPAQKSACKDLWAQWSKTGHHAQGHLHSDF
ncbi:hypothetical protein HMPREF0541_02065, partial [Lacticaseibacillus rhamnosus ATCC 21052]